MASGVSSRLPCRPAALAPACPEGRVTARGAGVTVRPRLPGARAALLGSGLRREPSVSRDARRAVRNGSQVQAAQPGCSVSTKPGAHVVIW